MDVITIFLYIKVYVILNNNSHKNIIQYNITKEDLDTAPRTLLSSYICTIPRTVTLHFLPGNVPWFLLL